MMWQQIWFVVNMFFVALLIVFLFMHRAVAVARHERDEERIRRARRWRGATGILTIVAFVAMVFSFLMNMRVNG